MNRSVNLDLVRTRALALADSVDRAAGRIEPYSLADAADLLVHNSFLGAHHSKTSEALVSQKVAAALGRSPTSGAMFLPIGQRDATVAGTGGYLVETTVGSAFAGALRARSVGDALGVSRIPFGPGNVGMPGVSGDLTAYVVSDEGGTGVSESDFTFSQSANLPKTVGADFDMSRLLSLQIAPATEAQLMAEAGGAVAAKRDSLMISGSGASGEPTGLLTALTPASGASVDWSDICTVIGGPEAANANAATSAWAVSPSAATVLRQRDKATNAGRFIMESNNTIGGYPAFVSNSVPSGVAIFGDWSQLVIGEWSAIEIRATNRATAAKFAAGTITVSARYSFDVAIKKLGAFAALENIS